MAAKQEHRAARFGLLGKYAYGWLTLAFFLVSLLLHWYFGWSSFVDEAQEHGQLPTTSEYITQMMRDTFENWQSEFLQLLWQVVGLTYFLYLGSPSSKEGDDRMEAKIDAMIRLQAGERGEEILKTIDQRYLRAEKPTRPEASDGEPAA